MFHVLTLLYIHLSSCININTVHYVLRLIVEGFLPLEQITESYSKDENSITL